MKRILFSLVLLMLCAGTALAQTQEEWNLSCNWKTVSSATVYDMRTDEPTVVGTVPAGAYVRIEDRDDVNDRMAISWMSGGVKYYGWTSVKVVRCTSTYRGGSGMAEGVHELDPNHDEIIRSNEVITLADSLVLSGGDYSDVEFEDVEDPSEYALAYREAITSGNGQDIPIVQPGGNILPAGSLANGAEDSAGEQPTAAPMQPDAMPTQPAAEPTAKPQASSGQKKSSSSQKKKEAPKAEPVQSSGTAVTLKTLGTYTSTVVVNGETHDVPTASLQYGAAPEDKRLAIIWAPRTGKASLRSRSGGKGDVLKQCKAGRIVAVLEVGREYSYVNYRGTVGWVLTDALKFHAPGDPSAVETALLAYNGRATGGTTINLRLEADGRRIGEYRTGTQVIVLGAGEEWTHVEVDGHRGYVQSKYLIEEE